MNTSDLHDKRHTLVILFGSLEDFTNAALCLYAACIQDYTFDFSSRRTAFSMRSIDIILIPSWLKLEPFLNDNAIADDVTR